jgi:hypothetical protein
MLLIFLISLTRNAVAEAERRAKLRPDAEAATQIDFKPARTWRIIKCPWLPPF